MQKVSRVIAKTPSFFRQNEGKKTSKSALSSFIAVLALKRHRVENIVKHMVTKRTLRNEILGGDIKLWKF